METSALQAAAKVQGSYLRQERKRSYKIITIHIANVRRVTILYKLLYAANFVNVTMKTRILSFPLPHTIVLTVGL